MAKVRERSPFIDGGYSSHPGPERRPPLVDCLKETAAGKVSVASHRARKDVVKTCFLSGPGGLCREGLPFGHMLCYLNGPKSCGQLRSTVLRITRWPPSDRTPD